MRRIFSLSILILALTFVSSNGRPQDGNPDRGAELYAQKCARCHGSAGEGGSGGTLRGCGICDSIEALFEKIQSEMPFDNPGDCTDACARDTAAFVYVSLNGHSDGGGCFISLSAE